MRGSNRDPAASGRNIGIHHNVKTQLFTVEPQASILVADIDFNVVNREVEARLRLSQFRGSSKRRANGQIIWDDPSRWVRHAADYNSDPCGLRSVPGRVLDGCGPGLMEVARITPELLPFP